MAWRATIDLVVRATTPARRSQARPVARAARAAARVAARAAHAGRVLRAACGA